MLRLISALVAVAALVVGVSFYMGWFAVTPAGTTYDGKTTNFNVSINKGKFVEDVQKGKDEVKQAIGVSTTPSATPDPVPTTPAPRIALDPNSGSTAPAPAPVPTPVDPPTATPPTLPPAPAPAEPLPS